MIRQTSPSRRITIRRILAACVTPVAFATTTLVATPAHADEPPRPPFYEAPAQLPASNGEVIRHEKIRFLLDPADLSSLVQQSYRVMYRSEDRQGQPIAVTGAVFVPNTAWSGPGERPVIGFAPGTQGLADHCAPSRLFSEGFEYETVAIAALLSQGYAVAITDYEGLGTEGVHTYMDRASTGHAVLDVVRAAQDLEAVEISERAPVGLQGYSQGGEGASAAVELAPAYAPELDVRGAAVGAVPADLQAVAEFLDGSLYVEFLLFAAAGLSESYDEDLAPVLNDEGEELIAEVETHCTSDATSNAFKQTSDYTESGESLTTVLQNEPWATIVDEQRLGRVAPQVPVYVGHSVFDDVIPFPVGRQLVTDWCDLGVTVEFDRSYAPTHVGGAAPFITGAKSFWRERFAGQAATSTC